jgi:hypothetical protein
MGLNEAQTVREGLDMIIEFRFVLFPIIIPVS